MELNPLFKVINRERNRIQGVVTEARPYTAKFLTCKSKQMKSLELGELGHMFNPSTGKAEAGRSLSLRTTWSTEQVLGQLSCERQTAG